MTREILGYDSDIYKFKYTIVGEQELEDKIELLVFDNNKWKHLAYLNYFDINECSEETLNKKIEEWKKEM